MYKRLNPLFCSLKNSATLYRNIDFLFQFCSFYRYFCNYLLSIAVEFSYNKVFVWLVRYEFSLPKMTFSEQMGIDHKFIKATFSIFARFAPFQCFALFLSFALYVIPHLISLALPLFACFQFGRLLLLLLSKWHRTNWIWLNSQLRQLQAYLDSFIIAGKMLSSCSSLVVGRAYNNPVIDFPSSKPRLLLAHCRRKWSLFLVSHKLAYTIHAHWRQ